MNRDDAIFELVKVIVSLVLFVFAFWMLWDLGWKVLCGLAVLLWANNFGLSVKFK